MARVRLRDLGIQIGRYQPGGNNAITDISGVLVGHTTVSHACDDGRIACTGVTAICPHSDNIFQEKVLGACHVINGFGKTIGTIQLQELGVIESPILLTNTFSVAAALEGALRYLLDRNPEIGESSGTVNVIVGECNDSYLNDIRALHVRPDDAISAIQSAKSGPVEEGCVGAGTGMSCLGYKGGVGTSSRIAGFGDKAYTLGALVVSNFGEATDLRPPGGGAPQLSEVGETMPDGSIMIILATDAPLSERQLTRLSKRAAFGLSRTGSYAAHGSGDVVIAFSTAHRIPHEPPSAILSYSFLREDGPWISQLFEMTAEAVEEAIWNSLCMATTTEGRNARVREAIPHDVLVGLAQFSSDSA